VSLFRNLHTHLNALITSRLPLAIPPHVSTPDTYLSGLIPFARVYIAFEKVWDEITADISALKLEENWIDVPLDESIAISQSLLLEVEQNENGDQQEDSQHRQEARVVLALRSLRPHGLARGDRLKRDISALAGIDLSEVDAFLARHESDATRAFISHIAEAVASKPQVLLAYGFVLYMAIFSGGRWIRSTLAGSGEEFWANDNSASPSTSRESSVSERLRTFSLAAQDRFETLGLAFWFFPSLSDGLDIKNEFKKRLEHVEKLLSPSMREDVIAEARDIFIRCEDLVGELDQSVGRQGNLIRRVARTVQPSRLPARLPTVVANWYEISSFAGLALLVSCASWYAMYHA
jgi:heme oxygenase